MNEYVHDLDLPKTVVPVYDAKIPTNYIPVTLSTKGKFGIPETIHVRNFTTSELLDVSLFEGRMLLEKTVSALNAVIYEKVDVSNWPEKALVELIMTIQSNYYSSTVEDIAFPWNQEDVDWLIANGKEKQLEDLREGRWVPRVSFPMSQIKTIELDSKVKTYISFSKKGTNSTLKAKFKAYPGFGDSLYLEKVLEEKFGEADKTFDKLREKINLRSSYISRGEPYPEYLTVKDEDYYALQIHEINKIKYIALASTAMYLTEFNGKSVETLSLDERIALVDSPEFDSGLGRSLNKKFEELTFGVDPEVEVMNPITGEVCKRQYTFQVISLLQALQSSVSDGYDFSYDD